MVVSVPGQAVITGIGYVSPFGIGGRDFVADVLSANRSAIGPMSSFTTTDTAPRLGTEVPSRCLPASEETRRWSRLSQMTVVACRQAVADADLHESKARHHFGLVVGTGFGDLRSTEDFVLGFLRNGPGGLRAFLFPNTVMNAMAGTTSIALGLKGPMLTLNQQGVAGEVAVARAITLIRAGRAPAVIACGVDELFPMLYETLALLGIPSPRDAGEEACRPFDQRHNGPVLGEGATAIVIESPEYARTRGAPILAEVYGACWGGLPVSPNRYPSPCHLSSRILNQALDTTAIGRDDVSVAYLSGSGDPQHDTAELALLAATFGSEGPLLTSVTHLTGEYGGLGTFRIAAAALTVTRCVVPTLDYLRQPIRTDVHFATQGKKPHPQGVVLVHGLARGGLQTAILIGPSREQQEGSR